MLSFKPLTEEEINQMNLIPKGKYKFRVSQADSDISKSSGHPQIKAKLRITMPDGGERTLTEYLSTNGQFMMRRLRHFCRATGLIDKYLIGTITIDDCLGKVGVVEIDIKAGDPKPDGSGNYEDKNIILDYFPDSPDALVNSVETKKDEFFNDDVPF